MREVRILIRGQNKALHMNGLNDSLKLAKAKKT